MSYSNFSMDDLRTKLGFRFIQNQVLFPQIPRYEILADLLRVLQRYKPLALSIDTEKARFEYIVAPMLAELKLNYPDALSLFSGVELNINKKIGLVGRCDFIVSRGNDQYALTAPLIMMVEAKRDNIKEGIPQCGAEMAAAQKFNQLKQNQIDIIYGCVTTGTTWKFLKLDGQDFYIDLEKYYIDAPDKVMGILSYIVLG